MSKKQILIVEDESIVAEDLKETLISLGYAVPSVESSGEKAIEKIEGMRPDLVLMDIMLQGAMDGIETAKEVHDRFDIPILYITSYSDEQILERAKITEPYCYIIKPFRERELHINIEIAIYKHQMENKLKESENWLSSTIKSLGEAVISTDKDGLIKTMNPFAEAMTGWKFDEAFAKPISTVFNIISEKPDIKVENPVTKAIREGIFYGLAEQTVLISKEGMGAPVDIIGSLIKDNFGNIMGTVMIFEDIIERKRLGERLKTQISKGEITQFESMIKR